MKQEVSPAIVYGLSEPPLGSWTVSQLLTHQATQFPTSTAVIALNSGARWSCTYAELDQRTTTLSKTLLARNVQPGDRVGILLGNCGEFVEVVLAVARIGAVAVLFHSTYTPAECANAVTFTGCSVLFTSTHLGKRDLSPCIAKLDLLRAQGAVILRDIVLLPSQSNEGSIAALAADSVPFYLYPDYLQHAPGVCASHCAAVEKQVLGDSVCIFQFTSGTTGSPKVTMLTHFNVIRNATLIGDRLHLTNQDVICCVFPLFHSGGLVTGLLSCLTHGSTIVFPSPSFDSAATLLSLREEACTGLHGVPTMYADVLGKYRQEQLIEQWPRQIALRTGIIGGASVSPDIVRSVQREFGLPHLAVAYGMTETSPLSFMSRIPSPDQKLDHETRIGMLLQWEILPHTVAKVVSYSKRPLEAGGEEDIAARGTPGELCISGYLLQAGYYKAPEKTNEVMKRDSAGTLWMHTGDEAVIDEQGHCQVTGRLKEMIIRGGECIHPAEIENRLNEHPAVAQSCVVGLKDDRLGEVVAVFLQRVAAIVSSSCFPSAPPPLPSTQELREWMKMELGAHKAPSYVFWLGNDGLPEEFPKTASGKVKGRELVDIGNRFIASGSA